MNPLNGVTIPCRPPNCMVKENYSACVGNVVQQKLLDLWIIYSAYPFIILEFRFCAFDVLVSIEGVMVEVEFLLLTTQVLQCYFLPGIAPVALWNARQRLYVVVRW